MSIILEGLASAGAPASVMDMVGRATSIDDIDRRWYATPPLPPRTNGGTGSVELRRAIAVVTTSGRVAIESVIITWHTVNGRRSFRSATARRIDPVAWTRAKSSTEDILGIAGCGSPHVDAKADQ